MTTRVSLRDNLGTSIFDIKRNYFRFGHGVQMQFRFSVERRCS